MNLYKNFMQNACRNSITVLGIGIRQPTQM